MARAWSSFVRAARGVAGTMGSGLLPTPAAAQQIMVTASSGAPGDAYNGPAYLAIDKLGNLFVSDTNNHRVQRVDRQTGAVTTVVGTGTAGFSGDGGPATQAQVDCPLGLAFDGLGNLYVADRCRNVVRKVVPGADSAITGAADEIISDFAGDGTAASCAFVNGVPASQTPINAPSVLATDQAGNLFMIAGETPAGSCSQVVQRVDASSGLLTTVVGIGSSSFTPGMVFDNSGDLFVWEFQESLLMCTPAGLTQQADPFSGGGNPGCQTASNGPSLIAGGFQPQGMAFDKAGDLYLSNDENACDGGGCTGVFELVPGTSGTIGFDATYSLFAGTLQTGYSGDGGPPLEATLNAPLGLALNGAGNLFIADSHNNVIRAVIKGASTPVGTGPVTALDQNGDASPVTVTFDGGVTTGGATAAVFGPVAPAPPAGFELAGNPAVFWDVSTSAQYTGPVTVCIAVNPVPAGAALWHFNSSTRAWEDKTVRPVPPTGPICAQVDSLSPFAILVPQQQAPAITSPGSTTFQVAVAASFGVTTSGNPVPTVSESGVLPGGVTFTDNGDGTATLAGTPAAGSGGAYSLTLTAANGIGTDAVQSFTLTVNQPPAITSADHATFTQGAAASFLVTTTGFPAVHLAEAGALPSGVSFVDNGDGTATLAGIPAASGTFVVALTAANGSGGGASQAFTLTVNASGPAAILTPGQIDFGNVSRYRLAVRVVTLQNTGSTALVIAGVSLTPGPGSDWDDFFFVSLCRSTLAAGQSCPIYVSFFAEDLGTRTATLNVANNAAGSPQQVILTGTAVKGR